jgi:formate-dependent nitrite reductase membrane component NrfD
VPLEDVPSYYDRPLLKAPVWTWEVPVYLFTGGAAGMAGAIAGVATMFVGDASLTFRALVIAAILAAVSPMLLISDLGRPSRFLNMLRVFKPQSPMSVGAWTLTLFTAAVFGTLGLAWLHSGVILIFFLAASMLLGVLLATYTGVLIGATAVPVWSRFVRLLPVHFCASALGAAVSIVELTGYHSVPLNRVAIAASAIEAIVGVVLERLNDPKGRALFESGGALFTRLGTILSGLIPLVIRTTMETSPVFRAIASLATVIGSLCTRFGWIAAGTHSTADPRLALGSADAHA